MDKNKEHKNWFGQNRKWAIPTMGCLSLVIITIIFASAMVTKLTGVFKDSVPYSVGMKNLTTNGLVIEALGTPIEANGMFQGNINSGDEKGNADIKIPVKGPKGEATLLIIAVKNGAVWTYQTMKVSFKDSDETVDLLETFEIKG